MFGTAVVLAVNHFLLFYFSKYLERNSLTAAGIKRCVMAMKLAHEQKSLTGFSFIFSKLSELPELWGRLSLR